MNHTCVTCNSTFARAILVALVLLVSGCGITDLVPGASTRNRATATPTIRPTFTPRATSTAWPTFTPSPTLVPATITPGVLTGVINGTVNLRLGPGTNYPVETRLSKGTRINVRGRDVANEWLTLIPPPNGWINAKFVSLSGDVQTLPVVEAPPTLVPTPTMAPSSTPQPTATPPMYVDFRADTPYLPAGVCTTLRWDVEGVRGVYLEGQGQTGHGSLEVCPRDTHTYVLHVALNAGYLDRAITITVLGAPTLTPKQ